MFRFGQTPRPAALQMMPGKPDVLEGVYHVRELLDTLAQDASEADRRRRALYSTVIHSLKLRAATDPFRQDTRRRIALLSHPRARRALRMPSTEPLQAEWDAPAHSNIGHAQLQYQQVGEHGLPSSGDAARVGSTHDRGAVRGCRGPVQTPRRACDLSRPDTVSTIGSGQAPGRSDSPGLDLTPDWTAWHPSRDTGDAGETGAPDLSSDTSGLSRACRDGAWDARGRAARGGEAAGACGSASACDSCGSGDIGAAEGAARLLSGGGAAGSNCAGGASGPSEAWDEYPDEFLFASVGDETRAVGAVAPAHVVPLQGESALRKAAILHRRRRWWYKPVAVLGGRFYSVSRGLGLQFVLGKRMVSEHLEPPPGTQGGASLPPAARGFVVYDCVARALAAAIVGRRGGRLAAAPVAVLRVSARGECAPPAATWPAPNGAWAFRVVTPEGLALERQVRSCPGFV